MRIMYHLNKPGNPLHTNEYEIHIAGWIISNAHTYGWLWIEHDGEGFEITEKRFGEWMALMKSEEY